MYSFLTLEDNCKQIIESRGGLWLKSSDQYRNFAVFSKELFTTNLWDLKEFPVGSSGFRIKWIQFVSNDIYAPIYNDAPMPADDHVWNDEMKATLAIIGLKLDETKTLQKTEGISRDASEIQSVREVLETGLAYRMAMSMSNRLVRDNKLVIMLSALIKDDSLSDSVKAILNDYLNTAIADYTVENSLLSSDDWLTSQIFMGWEDNSNEMRTFLHLLDAEHQLYTQLKDHRDDPTAHPLSDKQVDGMLKSLVLTFKPVEDKMAELNAKHVLNNDQASDEPFYGEDDEADEPQQLSEWMINAQAILKELDDLYGNGKTLNKHEYRELSVGLKRASVSKKALAKFLAENPTVKK